jgi:hypothetical protein
VSDSSEKSIRRWEVGCRVLAGAAMGYVAGAFVYCAPSNPSYGWTSIPAERVLDALVYVGPLGALVGAVLATVSRRRPKQG